MARWSDLGRLGWLVIGAVLGALLVTWTPDAPLHAVATDRQENFAVATGSVDENVEAIYFLDGLTGDLSATVLSPVTRKFVAHFQKNVLADLGVDVTKNPRYLLVTGGIWIRKLPGNVQPSASLAYVAELTSGRVAAYAIPWNRAAFNYNAPMEGTLQLVDVIQFRNVAVRNQ